MITSIIPKIKKRFLAALIALFSAASLCFVIDQDWLSWSNQCLTTSYDATADVKLKKFEINLTEDSFLRLRKTFQNGKQEYFSLQLQQLDDLSYLGNNIKGTLRLKTKDDDVIVQTYNDRKGNIDTMATTLDIPLKNIEHERLDSLQRALNYFKGKAL
ncbi:hypothetical protein ACFQZS_00755 [Mucilaginibacter calamicampi]|uniref:Uncharacterized protein n=1 Tax=Mucilaginibacter calamicampi TaxID=1302352 RepID=A0ABW2YQI6_9SPHI